MEALLLSIKPSSCHVFYVFLMSGLFSSHTVFMAELELGRGNARSDIIVS